MEQHEIHGAKGGKGGGGGGSQRVPREAPNTLRSASKARIIDLIGEGPIVGLANGLQSIYLDDTPLQNEDGSFNFDGVTVHTRDGEPDQAHIPGFPAVETAQDVSTQVTYDTPIVRSVTNPEADAVRVTVQLPALSHQNKENGDLNGSSVTLAVDVRPDGDSWSEMVRDTIKGKTTSPYQRTYRCELPGGAPWEVRVRRITPDSDSAAVQNDTYWVTYTEVIDAKLAYPDSALVALEVDAQEFGSNIPSRSYDLEGRIIQVPSNYDPESRTYSGIWDGSFKLAWSDNPAWIYYDLASATRYGADLATVDKWGLYAIGQYCDELVPDGYGGEEPRFTFNTQMANAEEAYTALQTLASAFRGMTYWGTNTVMAVADMPAEPVKLVGPANVIGGEFKREGSGLKARHSVALVTWNDPEDGYRQQIEVVEDPDAVQQYGWRQTEIVAAGCTSRGQANRLGRWTLYSERAETETLSYQAGLDHADLRPGEIIAVSDPARAGARLTGRLLASGTERLTLDAVPDDTGDGTWYLDVVMPTGGIERREVVAFDDQAVDLANPLSAKPVHGAMWVLSSASVEPELFRVLGLTEEDAHTYTVTALAHDPDKFARVEQGVSLPERPTSMIPTGPLPPPVSLSVVEYLYRAGPAVRSAITVSIQPPSDPRATLFETQVQAPGQADYVSGNYGSELTFDVRDTAPGEYRIRARALDATKRSPWHAETFSIQGLLAPPSDVEDLRISVNNGQVLLEWPPVTDLDLSHYRIKYSAADTGATWGASQDIAERVAAGATSLTLPARRGTYLIKAVDTSGGSSRHATLATSTVADLVGTNVVEIVNEQPAWQGDHSNTFAVNGALQLAAGESIAAWPTLVDVPNMTHGVGGVAGEGMYVADEIVDLGHVFTSRLTGELLADGFDILGVMASWAALADVDRMDLSEVSQWGIRLDVSTSSTPQPGAPTDWTAWEPLKVGEYTARAFRFRLHLQSFAPAVTPRVEQLRVEIDMPDRVADGQDLTCPPEGVRVSFSPAFMARPSLAVDAQGLSAGERKRISNIDAEGFDLQFLDAADNGVERTFDYLAKGYGRRVVT